MATTKDSTWEDFAKAALAIAHSFDKRWSKEVAAEFTGRVMHRCHPVRAIEALRSLSASLERLPTATEIIDQAVQRKVSRWIIFSREITTAGGIRKYEFARKVEGDLNPEAYLKPGETFIHDTHEVAEVRTRWHECEEGREFNQRLQGLSKTRNTAGPNNFPQVTSGGLKSQKKGREL